jgi:hypothetical protein
LGRTSGMAFGTSIHMKMRVFVQCSTSALSKKFSDRPLCWRLHGTSAEGCIWRNTVLLVASVPCCLYILTMSSLIPD